MTTYKQWRINKTGKQKIAEFICMQIQINLSEYPMSLKNNEIDRKIFTIRWSKKSAKKKNRRHEPVYVFVGFVSWMSYYWYYNQYCCRTFIFLRVVWRFTLYRFTVIDLYARDFGRHSLTFWYFSGIQVELGFGFLCLRLFFTWINLLSDNISISEWNTINSNMSK